MRSRDKKLEHLFDQFSASLAFVDPQAKGLFRCPVCWRDFPLDAISDKRLSLEHVPPSALGAWLTTITCTECNNRYGTLAQADLVESRKQEAFLAGAHVEQALEWHVDGKTFRALATPDKTAPYVFNMRIDPRHHDPKIFPTTRENAEKYKGATGTFRFRKSSNRARVSRAYLHLAYLAFFHHFGYPAVTSGALGLVREVLADPPDGELKCILPFPTGFIADDKDGLIMGVFEPQDLRCFVVFLSGHQVILPFVGDQDFEVLNRWEAVLEQPKDQRRSVLLARLAIDRSVQTSSGFEIVSVEQSELPVAHVRGC